MLLYSEKENKEERAQCGYMEKVCSFAVVDVAIDPAIATIWKRMEFYIHTFPIGTYTRRLPVLLVMDFLDFQRLLTRYVYEYHT